MSELGGQVIDPVDPTIGNPAIPDAALNSTAGPSGVYSGELSHTEEIGYHRPWDASVDTFEQLAPPLEHHNQGYPYPNSAPNTVSSAAESVRQQEAQPNPAEILEIGRSLIQLGTEITDHNRRLMKQARNN